MNSNRSPEKQAIQYVICGGGKKRKRFSYIQWPSVMPPSRIITVEFRFNQEDSLLHPIGIHRPTPGNAHGNTVVVSLIPPRQTFELRVEELSTCSSCVLLSVVLPGRHDLCNREVEALVATASLNQRQDTLILTMTRTGRRDRFACLS